MDLENELGKSVYFWQNREIPPLKVHVDVTSRAAIMHGKCEIRTIDADFDTFRPLKPEYDGGKTF